MLNTFWFILVASILNFAASPLFAQPIFEPFVKDELLVKFANGVTSESRSDAHKLTGSEFVKPLGDLGWHLVRIPDARSLASVEAIYRRLPSVIDVQRNFYYHLQVIPNDPQFSNAGMYGLTKISAPNAWDISTGSPSVVVANIDTGMRLTHEDLAANIWTNPGEIAGNGIDDDGNGYIDDVHGWDFRFNDSNPSDEHGHGTHVGGTIGAVGNNGVGVVGVNWNVRLMVIKIYSQAANDTTSAMLIEAYNYVRMMKENGVNVRVTNNSYGGCNEACGYDQATKDAIDALGEAGVLNVFAAGNSGINTDITPFYPGSYASPSILNVASSTSTDTRSSFSNFGVNSVDLAAPGSGIYSTRFQTDSSYGNSSGTSMAAPHVSGAAALLAAHRPDLNLASLKATLMNSADPLKSFNGLVRSGGRLNVFNALQVPTVCSSVPAVKSIFAPTKGGVFTIEVATPSNCAYSVTKNVSWIRILDTANLDGPASIQIQVSVNNTVTRSGQLYIGDNVVNISQSRGG